MFLSILVLPFWFLQDFYSKSLDDVRIYRQYYSMWEIEKNIITENKEENSNYDYINAIKSNYSGFSAEDLNSLEVTYFYLNYTLIIINFLLIFGLFEMITVSFYRYEIKKYT